MIPIPQSEYDLRVLGIEGSIQIAGKLQVLHFKQEQPVVFLMDETHADDCIQQNLLIACKIAECCVLSFAGVESRFGGYKWDDCLRHAYTSEFDRGESNFAANMYPQFGDEIAKSGIRVFGVECKGLSNELECDLIDNPDPGPIQNREFNVLRSKHFIRTLFQMRSTHNQSGNMILNVGGNHNTHIASFIADGTIESIVGHKATYVRLRAPAYREI